jgi:PAS domain S-box-containing protein
MMDTPVSSELEQLRQENARLRAALRHTSGLINIAPAFFGFISAESGAVLEVNDLALQVIGASRDDVIGRPFWETPWWKPLPSSAVRIREAMAQATRGRISQFDIEYWAAGDGHSGEVRWVAFTLTPFRDEEGVITRLAATGIDITDRKLGQDAALEPLRAVFINSPSAICVLEGPEHRFVLANPRYRALMGGRDVVGKTVQEALPELTGQGFTQILDNVRDTGRPYVGNEVPVVLLRREGQPVETVYINFVCQPWKDASASVNEILVHAVEVTELVQARQRAEALSRERQYAYEILENGDPAFHVDADFRYTFANAAHDRLVRRPREEYLGQPIWTAFPSAAAADSKYWTELQRAMRDRVSVHFVERFAPLDVWTDLNAYPTSDGGLAIFVRDVSERMQAEQERQKLVELVKNAGDFIGYAGLEGHPQFINPAGLRMTGLKSLEEAQALHILDFFPPEERAAMEREVLPAVLDQGRWDGVFRWKRMDTGKPFPVNFSMFLIRDPTTGAPLVFATATRDISEAVEREERLRARADLERQLIGIVSHDLRNPIQAILLSTKLLLKRGGLVDSVRKNLQRIQNAAERTSRMIRDLLDFTQARLGGGIPLHPAPMDLASCVQRVLAEMKEAFPGRRLELTSYGDLQGEWDGDRLEQVVANLVSNALKYSPEDGVVRVQLSGEATHVRLEVHNTGTPIPHGARPYLFQPMQRVSQQWDRTGRSVGLGLFIVRKVVEGHSGTVSVESCEAKGTTFIVSLPREPAPAFQGSGAEEGPLHS